MIISALITLGILAVATQLCTLLMLEALRDRSCRWHSAKRVICPGRYVPVGGVPQ